MELILIPLFIALIVVPFFFIGKLRPQDSTESVARKIEKEPEPIAESRRQDSIESAPRKMTQETVSSDTSTSKQINFKFCINCSTKVVRSAKFCHACGTPTILRETISTAPQVEGPPSGQTSQDDIQKNEKNTLERTLSLGVTRVQKWNKQPMSTTTTFVLSILILLVFLAFRAARVAMN